jgi:hypothetical protein
MNTGQVTDIRGVVVGGTGVCNRVDDRRERQGHGAKGVGQPTCPSRAIR